MYYALIALAVLMFGGSFTLNDMYRKRRGDNLKISLEMSFIGAFAGTLCLICISGFHFEFTLFTLLWSCLTALNGLVFTFFSFKALATINVSLYSLFSMLGGMMLPFFQGVLFYDEEVTVAKVVCVVLICVALAFTVTKDGTKKGYLYYLGVFVLNGMSGVLSKLFHELSFEKTSAAGYTFWICITTLTLSGIIWLILPKEKTAPPRSFSLVDVGIGAAFGGINRIANLLLVVALVHVETSVQYPLVTGGVMIVSTLLCFVSDRKPTKRELISVALAFLATLSLFLIPV